jgi:hypothetical protein
LIRLIAFQYFHLLLNFIFAMLVEVTIAMEIPAFKWKMLIVQFLDVRLVYKIYLNGFWDSHLEIEFHAYS